MLLESISSNSSPPTGNYTEQQRTTTTHDRTPQPRIETSFSEKTMDG
jgi:hypothetical protein